MSASPHATAGCCVELYELPVVEYLLGSSFHPGGPKLTRELAGAALIGPKAKVLDVACGIGNSARIIAADCGAAVTGCDLSGANVERAATASRDARLERRTRFVLGDAEQLPFAAQSFEAVVCECSLCLFDNTDSALQEMYRVLRPGGRIGVSDFFLNAPVPDSLDGMLGQALCVSGALSADDLRLAFAHAGFEHIRLRIVNWALAEMIKRVRHRLRTLTGSANGTDLAVPAEWGDPAPVLSALEEFIEDGDAGYLIVTARKR